MGWGISFALDTQGRVYCSDGCNWRANKNDYDGYPEWPSGHQSVLDYFEGEAHRELDMIRDECPGTAAALKEACGEHINYALGEYNRLTNQQKTELHDEMMKNLKEQIDLLEERKRSAKTRIEEIENIMEYATRDYNTAKSELTKAKRDIRLEKMFIIE